MENEEVDKVMDIIKQKEDRELVLDMLRHLHDDIEYVKRNVAVIDHKINGLTYLVDVASPMIVRKTLVENVVNPDTETLNLDELYSPIDEKDRGEWEKIKQEKLKL